MILLRVMAVCLVTCTMLASAEVNAKDGADQLPAIERARLRSLVDADMATARRRHADDFELMKRLMTLAAIAMLPPALGRAIGTLTGITQLMQIEPAATAEVRELLAANG